MKNRSRFVRVALLALFVPVILALVSACATTVGEETDASHQSSSPAESPELSQPPVYYVDAAVGMSGDGRSPEGAFKTIQEALESPLSAGSSVYIQPGVYKEDAYLYQSGAETVPMTTGVELKGGNKVVFPDGTDLSVIDLANFDGQYYLYLARSWKSNSGVYQVTAVDGASRTVTVAGASLTTETGVKGNPMYLSAAVGRPIRILNADPERGEVVLDVSEDTEVYTVFYIGDDWVDPCGANGPLSHIIVDGLTLTGSNNGGGFHIQCASYVLITNTTISNMWGTSGIYLNGNAQYPAQYNFFTGNRIFDTTNEAIYIGAGDKGEECNYTQFTHVIDNDISHTDDAWMENAIEVKEYNFGTVIEGNYIHDFPLNYFWNGAIQVQWSADYTLVYGNVLKDLTPAYEEDPIYAIGVESGGEGGEHMTRNVHIFDNLIYNTVAVPDRVFFAFAIRGDHTENVQVHNNTVYNTNGALHFHYEGEDSGNGVEIRNNVFAVQSGFAPVLERDWSSVFGSFTLEDNLFSENPGGAYAVSPEWVGRPEFVEPGVDFRLKPGAFAGVGIR